MSSTLCELRRWLNQNMHDFVEAFPQRVYTVPCFLIPIWNFLVYLLCYFEKETRDELLLMCFENIELSMHKAAAWVYFNSDAIDGDTNPSILVMCLSLLAGHFIKHSNNENSVTILIIINAFVLISTPCCIPATIVYPRPPLD